MSFQRKWLKDPTRESEVYLCFEYSLEVRSSGQDR